MNEFEKDGFEYIGEYGYLEYCWLFGIIWFKGVFDVNLNISFVGEFEDMFDIDFDGVLDFEENILRIVDF